MPRGVVSITKSLRPTHKARRTGLPPRAIGPIIRDDRTRVSCTPTDGRQDGTANVRMAPDVYAAFHEFRNLPTGNWERGGLLIAFWGLDHLSLPEHQTPSHRQSVDEDEDILAEDTQAPEFRVSYVTYQLEGAAKFWWRGVETLTRLVRRHLFGRILSRVRAQVLHRSCRSRRRSSRYTKAVGR
ncbi:hypothetical protein Dimus_036127 [Dionaea muscipula]